MTRRQRGTSLVEVLVTLVLVAVTMLGLLALQLRALSFQKDSFERRDAALIASGFLERVTANFGGFEGGGYNGLTFNSALGDTAPTTCGGASSVAAYDWCQLRQEVARRLPGGAAYVTSPVVLASSAGSARWVQVTVGWVDPGRTQALSGTSADLAVDPNCPTDNSAFNGSTLRFQFRCYQARIYP